MIVISCAPMNVDSVVVALPAILCAYTALTNAIYTHESQLDALIANVADFSHELLLVCLGYDTAILGQAFTKWNVRAI